MTDLVKRLREYAGDGGFANAVAMRKAADRIEQQDRRIAELKGALREILEMDHRRSATNCYGYHANKIASKALEGSE